MGGFNKGGFSYSMGLGGVDHGSDIATRYVLADSDRYRSSAFADLIEGEEKCSIAAWMNVAAGKLLFAGAVNTSSNDFGIQHWSDDVVYMKAANGSNSYATVASGVLTDEWEHWALVYDGSLSGNSNRLKAYRNGVAVTPISYTGTIPATLSADLGFAQFGPYGSGGDGLLSKVTWENASWAASAVQDIYNGLTPSTAWYFPHGNGTEVQQGTASWSETGSPDSVIIRNLP